jgi:hypothetical protein
MECRVLVGAQRHAGFPEVDHVHVAGPRKVSDLLRCGKGARGVRIADDERRALHGHALDEQVNRHAEDLEAQRTEAVDRSRALRGGVDDENRARPTSGTDRLDAGTIG